MYEVLNSLAGSGAQRESDRMVRRMAFRITSEHTREFDEIVKFGMVDVVPGV
jgi:hypothetical protein